MHFVSSLSDILSSYFVFVLCINFVTFWNQYTDSIVKVVNPLQTCLFGVVPYFGHCVFKCCPSLPFGGILCYKMDRNLK